MIKKLQGIIGPVDWDADGNIKAVALFTPGEKKYLISHNEVNRVLLCLQGVSVKITGNVQRDSQRHTIITVQSYELL